MALGLTISLINTEILLEMCCIIIQNQSHFLHWWLKKHSPSAQLRVKLKRLWVSKGFHLSRSLNCRAVISRGAWIMSETFATRTDVSSVVSGVRYKTWSLSFTRRVLNHWHRRRGFRIMVTSINHYSWCARDWITFCACAISWDLVILFLFFLMWIRTS